LKVVLTTPGERSLLLKRQAAECERLARRLQPGVPTPLCGGVWKDGVYFAMELLGGTLGQALERGALTPVEALEAIAELARSLHEVHETGLVHLDLRPERLLLVQTAAGAAPRVKVTGFALSLRRRDVLGGRAGAADRWANPFQAPEVKRAQGGPRADTYALGAITYALLTGGPPDAETWAASLVQSVAVTGLEGLSDLAWAALEATLRRALDPEPRQRFASARAFGHALAQALAMPAKPPAHEIPCVSCGTRGTPHQTYCGQCGHRAGTPRAVGANRATVAGFAAGGPGFLHQALQPDAEEEGVVPEPQTEADDRSPPRRWFPWRSRRNGPARV
jgi:serine/threonine protein kinase